jgi:predicted DNA-binding mobile mystery protein A
MPKSRQAELTRLRLDERLQPFREAAFLRRPPKTGWIGAIRKALGMTREQLGKRLGVMPATVADLERSESEQKIQLNSLQRAAEALDCELVYVLVPRRTLTDTVERRRDEIAQAAYRRTAHSMALESQLEDDDASKAVKIEAIRDAIALRDLWRE